MTKEDKKSWICILTGLELIIVSVIAIAIIFTLQISPFYSEIPMIIIAVSLYCITNECIDDSEEESQQ